VQVGVICFDSDPSGIITTDSRRDSTRTDMDSFQFILDTCDDRHRLQRHGAVQRARADRSHADLEVLAPVDVLN